MQQQIGIELSVTGQQQVTSTLQQLELTLSQMTSRIHAFTNAWANMAAVTSGGMSIQRIAQQFSGIGREAATAAPEVRKLSEALRSVKPPVGVGALGNVANRQTSGVPAASGASTRTASGGGLGGAFNRFSADSPFSGIGAPMFMLRFMAWHQAFRMGMSGVKDVLLGGARQELTEPLRDLGAIGFNKNQLRTTEGSANQFVRGFWTGGGSKDYLKAAAQAGSAFDVNDPKYFKNSDIGIEQLNRITQQSMVLGAGGQMQADKAAKLLSSAIHSQLTFMPKEEREAYESGEKKVADLGEKTATKMAQIIKLSAIWGTDIANVMSYSMATALQKGWKMDDILAVAGGLVTAGQKGSKIGRGLKHILEAEPGSIANLMIAGGSDDIYAKWNSMKPADQKKLGNALASSVSKKMTSDPVGFFQQLGPVMARAEKRGVNLTSDLGLSKEWIGVLRSMSTEDFAKKWANYKQKMGPDAKWEDIMQYVTATQDDAGWMLIRLDNEWKAFKQGLARIVGGTSSVRGTLEGALDVLGGLTYALNVGDIDEWQLALSNLYLGLWNAFLAGITKPVRSLIEWVGSWDMFGNKDLNLQMPSLQQFGDMVVQLVQNYDQIFAKLMEKVNGVIGAARLIDQGKWGDAQQLLKDTFLGKAEVAAPQSMAPWGAGVRAPQWWINQQNSGQLDSGQGVDQPIESNPALPGGATVSPSSFNPTIQEGETKVNVQIGDRPIKDIVIDVVRQQAMLNGETYGSSSMGGSSWAFA